MKKKSFLEKAFTISKPSLKEIEKMREFRIKERMLDIIELEIQLKHSKQNKLNKVKKELN